MFINHQFFHEKPSLDYVRRSQLHRETDLKKIAATLFPISGVGNDTWNESASNLWIGLALYLLDIEKTEATNITFNQIIKISVPKSGIPLEKWIEETINEKDGILGKDTKQYFRKFISATNRNRASTLAYLNMVYRGMSLHDHNDKN